MNFICTYPSKHCLDHDTQHLEHPEGLLRSLPSQYHHDPEEDYSDFYQHWLALLTLEFLINGIMQHVLFHVCLLLNPWPVICIHIVFISSLFFIYFCCEVLHCMTILQCMFPFSCQWTFRVVSSLGFYRLNCYGHSCTNPLVDICTHFSQVYMIVCW